ncbi:MAG: S41 family peptidase [Fimbriimonas sp.]
MLSGLSLIAALAIGQASAPAPQVDYTATEKLYGLSLFWKEASDHFAFFDKVPDLDWDKAYREAIPRVLATKTKGEYYREMGRFCALLKDGHTNITPPPDAGTTLWYPQLAILALGKRAYVTNIPKARQMEIPVGSEIVGYDGVPLEKYVEANFLPYVSQSTEVARWRQAIVRAFLGPKDETMRMTIVTPTGERKDVSFVRIVDMEEAIPEWVVPPKGIAGLSKGKVPYKDLGNGIYYVALPTFQDEAVATEFEALVPTLAKAKGLILDLRNNGGGNDAYALRVVRHFTREPFQGFAWRTREVRSAYRAWGQHVKPDKPNLDEFEREALANYKGTNWFGKPGHMHPGLPNAELLMPKVVLTGSTTGSAAEDMLIFMDKIPNITRVGERTFGSTGQPYLFDLPGGGIARVCTHRVTFPDGRELVGIGVIPHVEVELTVKDYLSDRDVVLDRGLAVLNSKIARP